MMVTAELKLEGLHIIVNTDVRIYQSEHDVYLSLNAKHLPTYVDGIIRAVDFDTDASLEDSMTPEYRANYRRFLGHRRIHLSALDISGFFNQNYDITFGFTVTPLLAPPCQVCNHDALAELLLYDTELPIGDIFKPQHLYELGDELLLTELDLTQAHRVLISSPEALQQFFQHPTLEHLPHVDITELKQQAILTQLK